MIFVGLFHHFFFRFCFIIFSFFVSTLQIFYAFPLFISSFFHFVAHSVFPLFLLVFFFSPCYSGFVIFKSFVCFCMFLFLSDCFVNPSIFQFFFIHAYQFFFLFIDGFIHSFEVSIQVVFIFPCLLQQRLFYFILYLIFFS